MDSSALKYAVHVSSTYTGDAGDVFDGGANPADNNNRMKFSAKDQDNDQNPGVNCAQYFSGGWWYNSCYFVNPTGVAPKYWGFPNFGLAGSGAIQKTRMMMMIIAD